MIFVTVGTHEQPFNRLVQYMDKYAETHDEEVVIQTGFSTYEPKNCLWSKLYPYQQMLKYINEARIVITHGGPSSFILPLQIGKIPIVIPRMKEFDEHVNNHQVRFAKAVAERQRNIIVVDDVKKLGRVISDYEKIVSNMPTSIKSNNEKFCAEFEEMVNKIIEAETK